MTKPTLSIPAPMGDLAKKIVAGICANVLVRWATIVATSIGATWLTGGGWS